jgi:hypothetical protein
MELFNNKENEILKFKINSEGIDVDNVEPRLILITKENKNILFIGKIEKDICKFDIPQLSVYEKGDHGKIKFEIISEDLYFPVWQDEFEIKSKASIKIEEMVSEIQHSSKPRISVTETKPIFEKKVETKKEKVVENKTLSKLEAIFENTVPVIIEEEEDEEVKIIEEVKKEEKPEKPSIMKFDSFK